MTIFCARLKETRKAAGLTQKQLADDLAIHRTTYTKYERGSSAPVPELLVSICRRLDISADYLLGLTDIKEIGGHGNP